MPPFFKAKIQETSPNRLIAVCIERNDTMEKKIRVTVWNEYEDEYRHPDILDLYPGGVHEYVKSFLEQEADMEVTACTFKQGRYHGIPDELIDNTDVLVMYSHMLQDYVSDERCEKVVDRIVNGGMGLIIMHSGYGMKLVRRLLGPGGHRGGYREVGEKERVWVVDQSHPITEGLPPYFEFDQSEVYAEPDTFPKPDDLLFISWYEGGEASRTGMTWHRGFGKIFYFAPGHIRFDIMQTEPYQRIMKNAVRWAAPKFRVPPLERGKTKQRQPLEPLRTDAEVL